MTNQFCAQIIDTSSNSILLTLKAGNNTPDGVLFSPNGKTFAFISHQETREYGGGVFIGSGRVEIWNINDDGTFTMHQVLEIGNAAVGAAPALRNFFMFNPDGSKLYDINGDNALQMWDIKSGRLVYSLPEAGHIFYASPDGTYLLMSHSEDTVKLWKLNSNQPPTLLQSLGGFEISGDLLAFSSDGHRLFNGTYPIAEWMVEPGSTAGNHASPDRTFAQIDRPAAVSPRGDLLAGQLNDEVIGILIHFLSGDPYLRLKFGQAA